MYSRKKEDWEKTNATWEARKEIWRLWSLGYTVTEMARHFQLHSDRFPRGPFFRDTIRKVKGELPGLPPDLVEGLLRELPEIRGFMKRKRPELKDK